MLRLCTASINPQGPHSYILLTAGGGPEGFFGSILAKGIFWGLKEAGIFLDIVLFISSGQQLQKYNLLLVWQNFGYAKTLGFFWVY